MSPRLTRGLMRLLRLLGKLVLAFFSVAYFTIARGFLFFLTLWVGLYFASGSGPVLDEIESLVASALPGRITVSSMQWGPLPWKIHLANAHIHGPEGQRVAEVEALEVDVAMADALFGSLRLVVDEGAPIPVPLARVRAVRPDVHVDVEDDGDVPIADAFVPEETSPGPTPAVDVRLERIAVEDLRSRIRVPNTTIEVDGMDLRGRLAVVGLGHLYFEVPWARAEAVDVALSPTIRADGRLSPVRIPARDVDLRGIDWDGTRFDVLRVSGRVGEAGHVHGRGGMDVGPFPPTWHGSARLRLPADSPLPSELVGMPIHGPLEARVEGEGTVYEATARAELRAPRLDLQGWAARDVDLEVGVEPRIASDGRMTHAFRMPRGSARVLGGRITLRDGRFRPWWRHPVDDGPDRVHLYDFRTDVQLEGVNPWRALGTFGGGTEAIALPFLDGSLDGRFGVSGGMEAESRRFTVRGRTDGLELTWAGASTLPLGERLRLHGSARWEQAPPGPPPNAEGRFRPVHRLELDDAVLESNADRLEVSGALDLARDRLDARMSAHVEELARFLAPFGVEGVAGHAELTDAELSGPLGNPTVRGRVTVREPELSGRSLQRLEAEVELVDGLLRVPSLHATAAWGAVDAGGRIRLLDGGFDRPSPTMPFRIEHLRARDVPLDRVAPSLGVGGRLTIPASANTTLRGEATRLLDTLEGSSRVELADLHLDGQDVPEASFDLHADPDRVALTSIRAVLPEEHVVAGRLELDKTRSHLEARVEAEALPFDAIRFEPLRDLPLQGRFDLEAHVAGPPSKLAVGGKLTHHAEEAEDEDRLSESPPTLELREGSRIELEGGVPGHIHLSARASRVELFDLLLPYEIPDASVRAEGIVELEAWPLRARSSWELRLDAPPDAVRLSLYDDEVIYRNLSELYLVQGPDGLWLNPVAVGRGPDDALTLCGRIYLDGPPSLDLRATGRADVPALGPLEEAFSVLDGALRIAEDPATAEALGPARCLPDAGDRVLRARGPLAEPSLSGRVQPRGRANRVQAKAPEAEADGEPDAARPMHLIPRGFGREIVLDPKGSLLLRPGRRDGAQRIVAPEDPERHLEGTIQQGSFEVQGELLGELRPDGFTPETVDARLIGTDLFYSSAGAYKMTLNPDVRLVGSALSDPANRDLTLKGRVLITDGLFFRNIGQLTRSLTGPGGTRYERPLTERFPGLQDVALDLGVEANEFGIRSSFPLGRAELQARFDLRVGGTLSSPELYDRVEIIPGGLVRYDVIQREFEIRRATLDFDGRPSKPRIDLDAETEILYFQSQDEDRSFTEERQVTVGLNVTGVPPDLDIQLTSEDVTQSEADLRSLVLTGRPSGQSGSFEENLGVGYDFGQMLSDVIRSPIFEALNVHVGAAGSVTTRLITRLGRAMRLRTRVVQEPSETRVSAGFEFELSDRLSLEGTLQRVQRSTNPSQTYRARFRYRIPLD